MEELLDYYIAQTLQVSLEEYVNKIEKTTFGRAEVIISACMGDDEEQHEKARRIFKLIL